jgi:hypothetical protein
MPFKFKMVLEDGAPADPPTFATSVPNWREGDPVMIRPGFVYRILEVRAATDDTTHGVWVVAPGVLVEETASRSFSASVVTAGGGLDSPSNG